MSFNLKVLEGPGICSLALAHFWGTKKLPEAQLDPCTVSVLHQKPQEYQHWFLKSVEGWELTGSYPSGMAENCIDFL